MIYELKKQDSSIKYNRLFSPNFRTLGTPLRFELLENAKVVIVEQPAFSLNKYGKIKTMFVESQMIDNVSKWVKLQTKYGYLFIHFH